MRDVAIVAVAQAPNRPYTTATPVEMMYLLVFCMMAVLFLGFVGRLHAAGLQVTNAAQSAARAASRSDRARRSAGPPPTRTSTRSGRASTKRGCSSPSAGFWHGCATRSFTRWATSTRGFATC